MITTESVTTESKTEFRRLMDIERKIKAVVYDLDDPNDNTSLLES